MRRRCDEKGKRQVTGRTNRIHSRCGPRRFRGAPSPRVTEATARCASATMAPRSALVVLLAAGLGGAAHAVEMRSHLNPVRKVVNMLQARAMAGRPCPLSPSEERGKT